MNQAGEVIGDLGEARAGLEDGAFMDEIYPVILGCGDGAELLPFGEPLLYLVFI